MNYLETGKPAGSGEANSCLMTAELREKGFYWFITLVPLLVLTFRS